MSLYRYFDSLEITYLSVIALITCCVIMAFVWLWSYKIKNAGVVDIFWSYNFPVIAVILFLLGPGYGPRRLLICSMVFIAGARLGTHLAVRILKHLRQEEPRYAQIRKEWGKNADAKMFGFFMMQAFSNVLLATPFFIIAVNTNPQLSVIEYIGVGLWLISLLGEAIADWQLKEFKKDPANKGKVCDTGLWNYSRHPNYFFEWLMWVSYFVFALASPYGYLAIISPAIILYLLLKVTGIPMTEEQSIKTKGEAFKKYQRTTSVFVPWFKKG
jgi:steroid 5-alpha reductase family enzyme